ncbi:hypothetical protein OIU85_000655 [Salix viminalis]|uniref:DUF7086 domain-containing protein n=1 Tax=Salix viminalis TaxID=40686 RepID=A0A9Q0VK44_SALVM|nr:hypothetical protein OIU85_000655 [Salix viminalis]
MENKSSYLNEQRIKAGDEELLELSLSTGSRSQPLSQPSSQLILGQPSAPPSQLFPLVKPLPPPPQALRMQPPANPSHQEAVGGQLNSHIRKTPSKILREGKSETIVAPYPWATTRRATVHSLEYLLANGLTIISGQMQCKKCDRQYEIEYDLQQKFKEVASFISANKDTMHDRAPSVWLNPVLPDCSFCNKRNCLKPVISKKRSINWLFLLLGQMLGCCQLKALKYFCKHTMNHRTGAKDRVLYLAYVDLCNQLDRSHGIV